MTKEQETGAFGLKIRPVKTKEELERLLASKEKLKRRPRKHGFTYIPKLGLYVADKVSMLGDNWYACKEKLNKKGSKMLTPAEFWIYYAYCVEKKLDIVENSLKNDRQDEWLDALVENERDLIINSKVNGQLHSKGTVYKNVVLKENSYFDRKDVNPRTGLPFSKKESGEFEYSAPTGKLKAANMLIKSNNVQVFFFNADAWCWYSYVGARECYTK